MKVTKNDIFPLSFTRLDIYKPSTPASAIHMGDELGKRNQVSRGGGGWDRRYARGTTWNEKSYVHPKSNNHGKKHNSAGKLPRERFIKITEVWGFTWSSS